MASAQSVVLPLGVGHGIRTFDTNFFYTNYTLNTSTRTVEFVFQTIDAITITKVGIRAGTITGTTPTYRVSLQGVDASGNPDGTIKGGGTPASKTFSPSSLAWSSNTWHWITLDNSYACGAGEFLSLVIDYSSGTVDASNNAAFSCCNGGNATCSLPYNIQFDGTTRTRTSRPPTFGYASSTTAYGYPTSAVNTITYKSDTAGADEYGIKFTLPAGWGDTYTLRGIRLMITATTGGSSDFCLYGGTDATAANSTGATTETTLFQSVAVDHDTIPGGQSVVMFDETTLTTLYYGATYRLTVKPTATVNVSIYAVTLDAASDADAYPLGQNCIQTKRLDAGNWTDVTTQKMTIELLFADITEPAAGGGVLLHGGMTGHVNG